MTIEQLEELERLAEKADPPTVKTLIRALRYFAEHGADCGTCNADRDVCKFSCGSYKCANSRLQQACQGDEMTEHQYCPCHASIYKDGNWNWKGHHVQYCPECGAHLSSCGLYSLMAPADGTDGMIAHLDNGQEALKIKRALLDMGCKPYWKENTIDDPSYMVPCYDVCWREVYPIMDHEIYINYLRRVYRTAKEMQPQ